VFLIGLTLQGVIGVIDVTRVFGQSLIITLKWRVNAGTGSTWLGPWAADLDNDGLMEIVIGGENGIAALNSSGSIIWFQSGKYGHNPIETVDLNKDGFLEILICPATGGVMALHGINGSIWWYNQNAAGKGTYIGVADINADGFPEIFSASPGLVTALTYDGRIFARTSTYYTCYGGISVGDTDFDGVFEVYLGERSESYPSYPSGGRGLRAFWAENLTEIWAHPDILCSSQAPAMADVDKDGDLEIIILHQRGGIAVINTDGSVNTYRGIYRKQLSIPGLPNGHDNPPIADLDGDGNLELITCSNADHDPTQPKIWDLVDWKLDATLPFPCMHPPGLADVNGDGKWEILDCNPQNVTIFKYNSNTKKYDIIGTIPVTNAHSFFIAQDIDADGKLELVFNEHNSWVSVWDVEAPAPNPLPRSGESFYSQRRTRVPEYVPPPGPQAPKISEISPNDGAINVPITLTELSFKLTDYQCDPINYTVTTNPDIGSASGINVPNGRITVPVSGLARSKTYTWTVTATDGTHTTIKTFKFSTTEQAPWYNEEWLYRKEIIIDHTKVAGDQTNFPVVIDLTDPSFTTKAQPDGDDFLFTDVKGVKLSHEIELYDSTTGHLVVWVKVPYLSSTVDTKIYLYYGNSKCGNQQDPTAVWDANNVLVLHLDETHECSMWGMIANTLPHDVVIYHLIDAPNSLKKLGQTNKDGWGLVYYLNQVPTVTRGPDPAYTDPNFDAAANAMANSGAQIGVGHVRLRSSGGLPPWGDPHPFMRYKGGKWWAFAHHGGVPISIMKNLIGPAYLTANPPTYGSSWDDPNIIDSDLYALWVLKCIEANNWDVTLGIAQAIKEMEDAGATGNWNFLLTDGVTLWAFRKGDSTHTLWYYRDASLQYSAIASVRPDTSQTGWTELANYNLAILTKDSVTVIADIRTKYPYPLLVDSEFSISATSEELRANTPSVQDWYESRGAFGGTGNSSLLTLDTNNIGGNTGKKAALKSYDIRGDAYLTQEFSTAISGTFTVSFDIYVDRILDSSNYDRTGLIYIGDDRISSNCPTGTSDERFVFLCFYDPTPSGAGNDLEIRARTSSGQRYDTTSQWLQVASGLSYDTWYTIRLVINVAAGTYDVYVNDVLVKAGVPKYSGYSSTSVSYISFSADSDGRGDFYVDNVYAPSRNRYKLTVNKVGNGEVQLNPGESSYLPATVVTLTAVPAPGWMFSGWSGDLSGTASPTIITMDSSKAVTATFTKLGYTLTVDTVGSGTVIKDPNLTAYPEGSVVTLTAVPSAGWSFSEWSGDASGNNNPINITMDNNKTVIAIFTQDQYTLSINIIGSGHVTKSPDRPTYTYGEIVTLTAEADPGWIFSHWSGDLSGSENPKTINVTSDKIVNATFIQGYTLTVNIIGSGSVSKDPDQAGYAPGTVVTLLATPAPGWSFSGWSGDLTSENNPATVIMDSNKIINATFTPNQYTLTINIVGGGSVSKNPDRPTYTYGEIVTLTATADPGWIFQGWSGDLSGSESPINITIDGDKNVNATFIRLYVLAVNIVGSGSVLKNPDQATYVEGSVVTLTATPATGWAFYGWSGSISSSENPITIVMDSDKIITATFTPIQCTLTINIIGSGSVSKNPEKPTYNYGETITLTAIPASGWSFFRWSGDLTGTTNPTTIVIDGNKVVTANFVQGTICYDSSVYGNNGALYGGATQGADGKIGRAVIFDGTTSYIEIPHSDTLSSFTQGFTASFWLKIEDTSRRQVILGKWNTGTSQRSWYIDYNPVELPTRPLTFYASIDGTNLAGEWYANFVPSAGVWYYVTLVWEANAAPRFYINGQALTIGTRTVSSIYNNVGVPLHIARSTSSTTRYFKGSLDEIRISNIARSAGYILTCYNNQFNPSSFYSVGPEEALPSAPLVSDPNPAAGATNVPLTLTELSFTLKDYQNDLMSYEVTTTPYIGGGSATGVGNGRYSVPVSNLQPLTTYTWHIHVTDGTHETDVSYTFTTMPRYLADPEFSDSADDTDLRANTPDVQDWYESRGAFPSGADPTLLTLDTSDVGGNTGKKAALKNKVGTATNAYLTQEFPFPMTSTFDISFDIYIDRIDDVGSYDRTGNIYVGDDRDSNNCPTGTSDERFVCLAFYDPTPGTTGNDIILKARTLSTQRWDTTSQWLTVAEGLSYDTWYTIKLVIRPASGNYDVYVNGVYKGTFNKYSGYTPTSVSYISFAADSQARGAFYVDNVFSPAIERYRLTVNTIGNGTVTKTPSESTYTPGTVVTLQANPASGWYFDSWSGDVSGKANPTTIRMDGDKTVTAIFTQSYTLTVNIVGSGTVSKDPDQTSYTPGTTVTLRASPAPGWYFCGWSGDLSGSDNPATITMDSSKVVTATFAQRQYTLTVETIGSGFVARNPDLPTYPEGTVVTLNAIPTVGWSFTGWSGDLSGTNNPATIIIDGNKTVIATFTQDQYTLTVYVEGGGSVTKTPDQPTYIYGTVVQLTATPEPGYAFSYWTGDLSGSNNPEYITMTGNKVVTAVFVWTQTNWWNPEWKYRRTVTIDRTKVSGDLTDFPILIEITDASLAQRAQSDGDDIVFTDTNNVKLSHEIELYDSTTGHLIAWVKVPYLSSTTDTVLYIYYGNPSCGNQQDPMGVWDANYKLVMHLDEEAGILYDSTENGNNGTPYGSLAQGATGYIGKSVEFNGGYIQLPRIMTTETQFTFSAWIYPRSGSRYVICEWLSYQGAFLQVSSDGRYIEFYINNVIVSSTSITLNNWYYIVGTYDGTTARLYVNNRTPTSKSTSNPIWPSQNTYIGDRSDHVRKFYGFIDEVRISNIARSAAWILTEYNNQLNPATFYSIGPEEQYAGTSSNSLKTGNINNSDSQQEISLAFLSPITLLAAVPVSLDIHRRKKRENK